MKHNKTFTVTKVFDRKNLKKVIFGKNHNNIWCLKTIRLDKDSLQISTVVSFITDETMDWITKIYLGIDVNSTIIKA